MVNVLEKILRLFSGAGAGDDETRQLIEETARDVVRSTRVLVDHQSEYIPAEAEAFPAYDAAFYDGTARDLAPHGIRVLGDFEDAAFTRRAPHQRAFYRIGVSDDGTVAAAWFILPPPPPTDEDAPPLRPGSCLVFETWLADGRCITTTCGAAENAVPKPAQVLVREVGRATAPGDALRGHRDRVGEARGVPKVLRTADDVLAARLAEEQFIAAFRHTKGLGLFEPMLRKMLGPNYDEQGAPLVEAIRRNPDWWTESGEI
ncbi:MAG: hypothetical protein ACREMJ_08180 [Gemmatimonadales bacterium]